MKNELNSKAYGVPRVNDDEILVVKVGSDEFPASEEDIKDVQIALAQCYSDSALTLVTHHCIDFVVCNRKDLKNAEILKD